MLQQHSLFWLFISDVWHQSLFYIGGVACLIFFLYEKFISKDLHIRYVVTIMLLLSGACFFQAWLDEHSNSEILKIQKAGLSAELSSAKQELKDKQRELDYLRDHKFDGFPRWTNADTPSQVVMSARDLGVAQALRDNTKMMHDLMVSKSASEKVDSPSLKQRALKLSQDLLLFAQQRAENAPPMSTSNNQQVAEMLWEKSRQYSIETEAAYNLRFFGKVQAMLADIKSTGWPLGNTIEFECGIDARVSECGVGLSKIANELKEQ